MRSKAYETALAGGAHAAWMRELEKLGVHQLVAARRSILRQIDAHWRWLENPSSKVCDWSQRDPRYRDGLQRKWQQDIRRQTEQVEIITAILRLRGHD